MSFNISMKSAKLCTEVKRKRSLLCLLEEPDEAEQAQDIAVNTGKRV